MKEKINIAELLKDCPKGMELDCTMYDDITLFGVDDMKFTIFPIRVLRKDGTSVELTKYGQYADADFAKCVIFPKGKTTWEDFVPPYKFKDGDVLSYQYKGYKNRTIYIYMQHSKMNTTYYVALSGDSDSRFMVNDKEGHALNSYDDSVRLATEEEKKKLFDAIKDNGYKWNPEIKTLEKLPKFKVGDKIIKKNGLRVPFIITGVSDVYYWSNTENSVEVLPVADQDDWELIPDIKPKFKVGDKIRHKTNNKDDVYEISAVYDNFYGLVDFAFMLDMKYQDLYELVPNKFDITTLIPFESKVLTRNGDRDIWRPAIFGGYKKNGDNEIDYYYVLGGTCWRNCIPYEGNEQLRGTTDDCNEFYKN